METLFHWKSWHHLAQIAMPLGLSFYVFQTMAYLIEVYRGSNSPSSSFFDFAAYISFFPKLIAGPIERAQHFLPQLEKERVINWSSIYQGFYLCFFGLYQKLFIAGNLARLVDESYQRIDQLNSLETTICIYAFAFQLYADFAGYSNVACGLSKMLGFEIIENFKTPFFAESILDFWKRWHISLTSWLRDFVFYPCFFRTKALVASSLLVFLLNGIWHGTGINFVLMGLYWGILVAINTVISKKRRSSENLPRTHFLQSFSLTPLAIILTFHLNCFGFLLFRSQSLDEIYSMLSNIAKADFTLTLNAANGIGLFAFACSALLALEFYQKKKDDSLLVLKQTPIFQFSFYTLLLLQVLSSYLYSPAITEGGGSYIYFRF
ncbi:MAG: hypothetical protein K2X27_05000, partial [Candidatus Obscuribacterales bacterium]|nr:hypothetical protein [Candidatus Obscuribacterales bacterium]